MNYHSNNPNYPEYTGRPTGGGIESHQIKKIIGQINFSRMNEN